MKKDYKSAFTMAEIIIAMTVIGVLAVMTLPALTANIDDRTFATRRIALYSRLSQAVGVIDSLSDAGRYDTDGTTLSDEIVEENAAMAFVLNKLSQGLKIESTCTLAKASNCGMDNKNNFYAKKGGGKFTLPANFGEINAAFKFGEGNNKTTKGVAFTTKNGDSIAIYYNPDCLSGAGNGSSYKDMVCANFFYDLNGRKGPNMMGKDVGIGTILFSTGSEVVMPSIIDYTPVSDTQENAINACVSEQMILPSRNELISMALNKEYLFKNPGNGFAWSGTNVMVTSGGNTTTQGWQVDFTPASTGMRKQAVNGYAHYYCTYPLTNTR